MAIGSVASTQLLALRVLADEPAHRRVAAAGLTGGLLDCLQWADRRIDRRSAAPSGAIPNESRPRLIRSGIRITCARRIGTWGPKPRLYAPARGSLGPAGMETRTCDRHCRTIYRLRLPAPPYSGSESTRRLALEADLCGHNGPGFDCSNFTSFVFNQGFGIKISSGIGEQCARIMVLSLEHPGTDRTGGIARQL